MPAEEGKQPIQHLQENTTLRGDKTLRVKQAFCMVNNKIQQLRGDMRRTELAQVMPWRERVPYNGTASRGHRLFEAHADQGLQDCNTREAYRLLLVVKVVFVVFPNSAGRIGNSTNPITRFSG